jgi:hypothetical protein
MYSRQLAWQCNVAAHKTPLGALGLPIRMAPVTSERSTMRGTVPCTVFIVTRWHYYSEAWHLRE